jgi:hypothetical protein
MLVRSVRTLVHYRRYVTPRETGSSETGRQAERETARQTETDILADNQPWTASQARNRGLDLTCSSAACSSIYSGQRVVAILCICFEMNRTTIMHTCSHAMLCMMASSDDFLLDTTWPGCCCCLLLLIDYWINQVIMISYFACSLIIAYSCLYIYVQFPREYNIFTTIYNVCVKTLINLNTMNMISFRRIHHK